MNQYVKWGLVVAVALAVYYGYKYMQLKEASEAAAA
jgi:hypothetical protein